MKQALQPLAMNYNTSRITQTCVATQTLAVLLTKKLMVEKKSIIHCIGLHGVLSMYHYHRLLTIRLRGFAKVLFLQKSEITMEVGGWVQVSLGICFWEIVPK